MVGAGFVSPGGMGTEGPGRIAWGTNGTGKTHWLLRNTLVEI